MTDVVLEHRLAIAHAIVYATASSRRSERATSDADLGRLPGIIFLSRKRR